VDETDAAQSGSSPFAGGLDVAPGKHLTVAPRDPKPYGHYDVLAGHDRVGALVLGGSDALARMIRNSTQPTLVRYPLVLG
jgi:hypothetical protein